MCIEYIINNDLRVKCVMLDKASKVIASLIGSGANIITIREVR